jgi:hypothetical protein
VIYRVSVRYQRLRVEWQQIKVQCFVYLIPAIHLRNTFHNHSFRTFRLPNHSKLRILPPNLILLLQILLQIPRNLWYHNQHPSPKPKTKTYLGNPILLTSNRLPKRSPSRHNTHPSPRPHLLILHIRTIITRTPTPQFRRRVYDANSQDLRACHFGFGGWDAGVLPAVGYYLFYLSISPLPKHKRLRK